MEMATVIQTAARRFLALLERSRREDAVLVIQAASRGALARWAAMDKLHAIVAVQAAWRGLKARRRVRARRRRRDTGGLRLSRALSFSRPRRGGGGTAPTDNGGPSLARRLVRRLSFSAPEGRSGGESEGLHRARRTPSQSRGPPPGQLQGEEDVNIAAGGWLRRATNRRRRQRADSELLTSSKVPDAPFEPIAADPALPPSRGRTGSIPSHDGSRTPPPSLGPAPRGRTGSAAHNGRTSRGLAFGY